MQDEAPFSIRYDKEERVLHMRLVGFWTKLTLAAYVTRLAAETMRLRLLGQRYDILSDTRDFGIQNKDVSEGFEKIARRGAEVHLGRTAIVVGTQLNKLQAERTLAAAQVRVFLDLDEAKQWLAEGRRQEGAA